MAITGATNLVPAPSKQLLASAYIDFTSDTGNNGWQQQYLPELMAQEAEVFGNRTIAGFLSQVGAEESMTSDQVVWSEQGRLHLSYTATMGGTGSTLVATHNADGVAVGTAAPYTDGNHGIRVGDMLLIADNNVTMRAYAKSIDATGTVTIQPYDETHANTSGIAEGACKVLVFGSEYAKGDVGRAGANTPAFQTFTNKPIILKDKYEISGSDASAIGWVEVSGEEGQNGYLWYLKANGDTMARFGDYCEMA